MFRYLLTLESGEPVDPAIFVTPHTDWHVGDRFAANDGSRWVILSIETALNELAARDLIRDLDRRPDGLTERLTSCRRAS